MKHSRDFLVFVLLVIFFVPLVQAGVIIVNSNEAQDHTTSQNKTYLEKDRVRMEMKGAATHQIFIFRQDKELFWFIDNKTSTYSEINKQDLDKMKSALEQMEEQMKNIPPEKREMVEKMMRGKMPSQPPKPQYKKVGSGEKVNQWICDKFEGYRDNKKGEDIWTTDPKNLGLTPDDFNVLQEIGKFFEGFGKMASSFYKVGSPDWEKDNGYSGIPIKTITYSGDQVAETMELKEIQHQDISPTLFDLPGGLKKEKIH
jgi:hypothetical protein